MLYDIILSGFNADEIMIIDLCMTLCNMDATQAYNAVDNMPYMLVSGVDMQEAKKIKKTFEYEGAFIDVTPSKSDNANDSYKESSISNNNNDNMLNELTSKDNVNEGTYNGNKEDDNNFDFIEDGSDNNEEEYEEGINLEKVFEQNVNINMIPNDYGDYSLEKLEQDKEKEEEEEGQKLKQIFDEFVEETTDFSNCTYNSNDKPVYSGINKPSKKYISKEDIIRIERERNNNINKKNEVDVFNVNVQSSENKSNKKYITKEYMDAGFKQEIIASDDSNIMDFGNNPYDKDCMQINTQKGNIDIESSEQDMKNLYNKKALNNMTQFEEDKVDNQWIKALKKSNNKGNAHNTNAFQKEEVMCPKCGSAFVACKKSQGFFGTGKIKYVCEACRYKF